MNDDYDVMSNEIRRLHKICRVYRKDLGRIEKLVKEGIKHHLEIPKTEDKSTAIDAYMAVLAILENKE